MYLQNDCVYEYTVNSERLKCNHLNVFQGLILDNPTFILEDFADILYQKGLIDKQGLFALKSLQDAYNEAIGDGNMKEAQKVSKYVNPLIL